MSKRSRPRASNSGVTAKGNASESFGIASASCSMLPRATVPSTRARSDRPSPKKSVGESGRCLGWRAARLPPKTSTSQAERIRGRRQVARALNILHLADVMGLEAVEQLFRAGTVELGVLSLDAQKEAVVRRQRKTRH